MYYLHKSCNLAIKLGGARSATVFDGGVKGETLSLRLVVQVSLNSAHILSRKREAAENNHAAQRARYLRKNQ